jgi:hypothetical protein
VTTSVPSIYRAYRQLKLGFSQQDCTSSRRRWEQRLRADRFPRPEKILECNGHARSQRRQVIVLRGLTRISNRFAQVAKVTGLSHRTPPFTSTPSTVRWRCFAVGVEGDSPQQSRPIYAYLINIACEIPPTYTTHHTNPRARSL